MFVLMAFTPQNQAMADRRKLMKIKKALALAILLKPKKKILFPLPLPLPLPMPVFKERQPLLLKEAPWPADPWPAADPWPQDPW
jgi:hypothetical protein